MKRLALALTLISGGAWGQCTGGLLANCPAASGLARTDSLFADQASLAPHSTRRATPAQILGLLSTADISAALGYTLSAYPVVAVASLPAVTSANMGALAFATNCRNGSETAGNGTGCLVAVNNAGAWKVVGTGLTPTN